MCSHVTPINTFWLSPSCGCWDANCQQTGLRTHGLLCISRPATDPFFSDWEPPFVHLQPICEARNTGSGNGCTCLGLSVAKLLDFGKTTWSPLVCLFVLKIVFTYAPPSKILIIWALLFYLQLVDWLLRWASRGFDHAPIYLSGYCSRVDGLWGRHLETHCLTLW